MDYMRDCFDFASYGLEKNLMFENDFEFVLIIGFIYSYFHCIRSVCIRSFSGPYFLAFELNTQRYSLCLRIQSECGKKRTIKSPNMDTFHAVLIVITLHLLPPSETYSELCQTSKAELFAKIVNYFNHLTIYFQTLLVKTVNLI